MSPAPSLTFDEASSALLDAADELFYKRGIAAVTIAEIRDLSGVSLRRLYSLYPAKSDLVAGWLERRHDTWTTWLKVEVTQRISEGRTAVDAVFDALGSWLADSHFRGCGFINSLAETAELTPAHLVLIQAHKQSLIDYLDAVTGQGQAMGVIVDGAIVQAAVFKSNQPLEAGRRAALSLIPTQETE